MLKRNPNPFIGTISDSVAVAMGDYTTIYVSGQVGNDASGRVTAKNFEEEARLCLGNVSKALEKSGASLADVVRITAYLTDLADYPVYSRARGAAFGAAAPASATVQVAGLLADAKLEIDAVAVVKTKR
jgi:enamine deaminase RidA (YjgF/YER057c/UK114 family)